MNESMQNELSSYPALLNLSDLMSFLRISERQAYRLIKNPALHAWKADGEWCVTRADLIAWLDSETE
ncbi:MAG: helix-turn-helix domain-containing protein [Treponema sp.]|nr:helix-turn-helix domain-containing protein [Treponema sp.]